MSLPDLALWQRLGHRAALSRAQEPSRPNQILREVAERHGISVADLTGSSHRRKIAYARFEAAFRLRTITIKGKPASYPRIARWLGGRDHTTIIRAVRRHIEIAGSADV